MKEPVRKALMAVMAIGFFTGFAILLYPLFSSKWNQYNNNLKFDEYELEVTEKVQDGSIKAEWEKAAAYNNELKPIIIPDSFIQAEVMTQEDTAYLSCLNIADDGMMGYISIPKLKENIPIYHTTAEEVLQKGAGHVHGSSLPVGGTSTHAVIAAHRGLPGMSLFTDLDQLKTGDQFYLYILDEILAYEVDQILIVMPEDTEALTVENGSDYVTLITCTPYGVNTHRMLVRGHRVPYEEAQQMMQAENAVHSIHTNYVVWIMVGLLAAGVCMLFCGIFITVVRKKKNWENKKPEEAKQ